MFAVSTFLKEDSPSLDEFSVAFKEIVYTNSNSKQKNLVRYILQRFSEHHKYKFSADFDDLTIEHLHPQSKVGATWPESVVGSLGNLIFVDGETNEKLSTKAFDEKKKILINSGCSIPSFVKTSKKWMPRNVADHTLSMAELAHSKIWKI